MAEFTDADMHDSRFERVTLTGTRFRTVELDGSSLRDVSLRNVAISDAVLANVDISGELENVTVNGVDIGPLVDAELNRRYPDRAKMRPTDPAGFSEAWDILERLWAGTVDRARQLDPALLYERVNDEFCFVDTLRHLVFATDSWIRRAILGDPRPWHPLGLPWEGGPPTPGIPCDWDARPPLDEVLALRRERMSTVREVIDCLTESSLAHHTEPVEAPGWPESRSYPVRKCLSVILNEEWEHRLYAERDLAILEAR